MSAARFQMAPQLVGGRRQALRAYCRPGSRRPPRGAWRLAPLIAVIVLVLLVGKGALLALLTRLFGYGKGTTTARPTEPEPKGGVDAGLCSLLHTWGFSLDVPSSAVVGPRCASPQDVARCHAAGAGWPLGCYNAGMAAEHDDPAQWPTDEAPAARIGGVFGRRRGARAPGPRSLRAYVAGSAAVCVGGLALNQAAVQAGSAALARWIPSAQLYGEVSLLLQFLQLAALTLGLGLNSALVYDIATARPLMGRSYAAARGGMLALGVLPLVLCMLVAPLVAHAYGVPALAGAIRIGAFVLLAQVALNAATAVQMGLRRFGIQMALMVAATVLAVVGRLAAVPAVLAGASVGWVALAGGVGIAAVAVAGHVLGARLRLPGAGAHVRDVFAELPRMLRYGWPLWASNLLKAFQNPYLVLVAGGTGVAAAGFVTNDVALLGWPFLVTWALRLVAVPLVASGSDEADRRARTTVCFRLNHLVLVPLVALFVFWPRELVTAVYGVRYAAGAALLPLLVVGVYGSSIGRLATDALAGVAQTRASLPIMIIACVPLLLGAPLALRHGAVWLAGLYCAGWVVSAVFALWQLRRIGLGVDARAGFFEPILPTVAALPLALWGAHVGGGAGHAVVAVALVVLGALTVAVYRMEGRAGRGAGVVVVSAPVAAEAG